jgi:NAD(P)-dependent dehydrogenase (short-subunit alcohol dehydrogenase family)
MTKRDASPRQEPPPRQLEEPSPPFPAQHLEGTGEEARLRPRPRFEAPAYRPAGKLEGRKALVTGGDSGIGRAVAYLYAREGADVAIAYHTHEGDAVETTRAIEGCGRRGVAFKVDVGDPEACRRLVEQTVEALGGLDILVSNAAVQTSVPDLTKLSTSQVEDTFRTNVFGYLYLVQAALPHLEPGAAIIATGSETGLFGSARLPDYSASKGAIHALTRTLAQSLIERGIRVNAVAPGPVWTPLNPSDDGTTPDKVAQFGASSEMKRPAQPEEIAPAYVFFASAADSSFITGQVLPVLGGTLP